MAVKTFVAVGLATVRSGVRRAPQSIVSGLGAVGSARVYARNVGFLLGHPETRVRIHALTCRPGRASVHCAEGTSIYSTQLQPPRSTRPDHGRPLPMRHHQIHNPAPLSPPNLHLPLQRMPAPIVLSLRYFSHISAVRDPSSASECHRNL